MAANSVIGALRVNLGLDSAEFTNGIKQVQSKLGGLGRLLSASFVVAGVTAFSAGVGAAVGRLEQMRKLSAQLDRALMNTGNTAQTSAAEVEAFADRLERSTGRAAEEVMAVSTNLATFGFGNEQFFRAITLADDMAAAWGGDLKQNIEGLARALADPEKGLAMLVKRGITFDDQQKAQIANFMKVNDLAGAQGVIFEALERQVKGVAASGFTGLTKAGANLTKAIEDMFEAIASGLHVGTGLEMALTGIAAGVDFVTANIGTLGKIAGVVGTAMAVALGPTVWAAMTSAAVTFGNAAVAAVRALGVAIAANPIGFLVTAFAAAVAAAFLFRDEIKAAIGVDLVDIVKNAANGIIGIFVGAYEAVKVAWGNLPAFFSTLGKRSWNALIEEFEKPALTVNGQVIIPGFDLSAWKADLSEVETATSDAINQAFDSAQGVDYIGNFVTAVTEGLKPASEAVAGFNNLITTGTTEALEGAGEVGKAALGQMTDAAAELAQTMESVGQSIGSSLRGLIDGTKDWKDVLLDLAGILAKSLFKPASGNDPTSNLLSGLIGGLMGFANGGSFKVGGAGGIDSQLVAFRASPNERVSITKPGQDMGAGGTIVFNQNFVNDGAMSSREVLAINEQRAAQTVEVIKRSFPGWNVQLQRNGAIG